MKKIIDVGLAPLAQPFSWMVGAGDFFFTTHGPVLANGTIDKGPIAQQTRITLENLQRAVLAAGCTMDDVVQVLIYMTDVADMSAIDAVYREFFKAPYPNRSSAGVALVVPGMKIEMVAYVHRSLA